MPFESVLGKLSRIVATLALIACGVPITMGQASVPENQETSFLYVDAANGSDSNPGITQMIMGGFVSVSRRENCEASPTSWNGSENGETAAIMRTTSVSIPSGSWAWR